MSVQQTEKCDNCLKQFPESKIATHFGYCRRNIKKCPKCGQMYDINSTEQHEIQFHKLTPCKHCKKQFKPNEVAKHEQTCNLRTQYCEYCELNVPLKDYGLHLKDCEARTKICEKCRKPITNKDYLVHTISCPGFVEQVKPQMEAQKNKYNYNQYNQNNARKQYKSYQNNFNQQIKQEPKREIKPSKQIQKKYGPTSGKVDPPNRISNRQTKPPVQTKPLSKPDSRSYQYSNPTNFPKQIKNSKGYPEQKPIRDSKGSNKVIESKGTKGQPEIDFSNDYKYSNQSKSGTGSSQSTSNPKNLIPGNSNPSNYQKSKEDVPKEANFKKQSYNYEEYPIDVDEQAFLDEDLGIQTANQFDIGQDEQLQKAIMASLGTPVKPKKSNKPDYKVEGLDSMNQSFYDKQWAIMEDFQKKKKK